MNTRQLLGAGLLVLLSLACGGGGTPAPSDGVVPPQPPQPGAPKTPASTAVVVPDAAAEPEPVVFVLPTLLEVGDPGAAATPEVEPNDTLETATPLHAAGGRGVLESGKDEDLWSFQVEDGGLWGIDIHGEGVEQAHLEIASGRLQTFRNTAPGLVRLEGLGLAAGTHVVRIRRGEGPYRIKAMRIADTVPNVEREPNDSSGTAHRLELGVARGGWLSGSSDADVYRFTLRAPEHVRLGWTADEELKVRLMDRRTARPLMQGRVNPTAVPGWEGWLQPGDYELELKTSNAATLGYAVRVDRRDSLAVVEDREPNDLPDQVGPNVAGALVSGSIGLLDRRDLHRLPGAPGAAVTLKSVGGPKPPTKVSVRDAADDVISTWDAAAGVWRATLPADGSGFLHVGHPGDYAIQVDVEGWEPPAVPAETAPVVLRAAMQRVEVAAFADIGQRFTLPITYDGTLPATPHVHLSDDRWRARVISKPNSVLPLSVSIELPADVPATPGLVTVGGPGMRSTSFTVDPVCGGEVSYPTVHWALPKALVGGLDVAWLALGATVVDGPDTAARLFDHVSPNDSGLRTKTPNTVVTVKLAGDAPAVRGLILDAHGRHATAGPRPFRLELSTDGVTFEPALDGWIPRSSEETAFVLPAARNASHARLILPEAGTVLGEVKIVAEPGSTPLGEQPLSIGDPARGGMLVRSRPYLNLGEELLGSASKVRTFAHPKGQPMELVFAFEHTREARLQRLEWDQPVGTRGLLTTARVSTSATSPIGPWTDHGVWTLPAAGATGTFPMNDASARYVRFTNTEDGERKGLLPTSLRFFESTGPSVLGEYGRYDRRGPAGMGQSVPASLSKDSGPDNDSLKTATPLAGDSDVAATVSVGVDRDVYAVSVPAGANEITLDVDTSNVAVEVLTPAGDVVPMQQRREGRGVRYTASTAPGPLFVRVTEPPRSVALLWDRSGSVSSFIPQIHAAVGQFVEGVEPEREVANLMPFRGRSRVHFLSETWSDDPSVLQAALLADPRTDPSSDAESSILAALREMEGRPGTKALLVLTDADSSGSRYTPELWDRFTSVRPRVFTMELHIGNAARHQDRMQAWSDVDDGHASWFASAADLDDSFERATCHLRRPQPYTLRVSSASVAPPEPGAILVVAPGLEGMAVELILDASGSMLQRLGGKSRIDIARATLDGLVENTIPAGTPLALRVFGHREAGSCQTDLEVPMAPLDPVSMKAKLASVRAKNLAKTPIGASLRAVEKDLAAHTGPKLVVLLTDGEETCDGDPPAAIEALEEAGLDVRLNIVGFAIDDAALRSDFEAWARAAGGVYVPANSEEELSDAMNAALSPAVVVLDATGEVVAKGTAGTAIDVPAGVYTVKVLTTPVRTLQATVTPAGTVTLDLATP